MRPRRTLTLSLVSLLAFTAAACTEKAPVEILDPPRGAMLPAGQPVTVRVKADDKVRVNGTDLGGSGTRETTVPAVDGLGFVVAEVPGDPLLAVRSYHQGTFRPSADWHPGTLAVALGAELLDGSDPSVASLTSTLLTGAELESFVEDPLTMTVTVVVPVTVNVYVDSVVSPDVAVSLWLEGATLRFSAVLTDTDVDYRAQATALSSSGTARYAEITVTGTVTLTADSVTLGDLQVTHGDPTITDSGGLPAGAVATLATTLNGEVPDAVATAAQNAAEAVFALLVNGLKPQVGVSFPEPLTQESRPTSLVQDADGIHLDYETLIQAATPDVATEAQGVLQRVDSDEAEDGTALGARIGRALVNQLAFAAWDAGNFAGLAFTKAELEGMGMEALEFPYSNLQRTTITLLLPPLLEWDVTGPWLDLGGIQIDLVVEGNPDSTAWTAGRVPVRLVPVAGADHQLRLEVDPAREVALREVGFDQMSTLVSLEKVQRLLRTAVPGVVSTVFGDLPAVELVPMTLTKLDGTDGPVLHPRVDSVTPAVDGWRLRLVLAY